MVNMPEKVGHPNIFLPINKHNKKHLEMLLSPGSDLIKYPVANETNIQGSRLTYHLANTGKVQHSGGQSQPQMNLA